MTDFTYTGDGDARRIHTWTDGERDIYIRDSPILAATALFGKSERYELRLHDPHGSRYDLPVTHQYGSYETESEAVAAAVDLFGVEEVSV